MNIAIDIRALMGNKVSGVTVYMKNLIRNLIKLDSNNFYFLFYNSLKKTAIPEFTGSNVKIIRTKIPNKILNLSLKLLSRPFLDELIGEKIDVFFMPDLRPSSLSKNVKILLTVHDLSFDRFPSNFSLKTRLWHKLLRPKTEIGKVDHLISVSNFTKNEIKGFYHVPDDKIDVIYHGGEVETENIENDYLEKMKDKFSLPDHFILSLSAIEPRKNIKNLIKAVRIIREKGNIDINLILAGTEDLEIFKDPGISDSNFVKKLGFVEEMQKKALYLLADCFVYPSYYEGFGLPVLEAMQAKCPIAFSKNSAMEEIAGSNAITFDPHDVLDISNCIEKVLFEGKKSNRVSALYQKSLEFSWEKCAKETLKLLERIASY